MAEPCEDLPVDESTSTPIQQRPELTLLKGELLFSRTTGIPIDEELFADDPLIYRLSNADIYQSVSRGRHTQQVLVRKATTPGDIVGGVIHRVHRPDAHTEKLVRAEMAEIEPTFLSLEEDARTSDGLRQDFLDGQKVHAATDLMRGLDSFTEAADQHHQMVYHRLCERAKNFGVLLIRLEQTDNDPAG